MNVNVIAITPPKGDDDLRKVTPELLASSLAKYSRSNEGIDEILNKIDWDNPDASVDRIFKFVDYGHASIGGMTGGIAITVDDCSMFLAYKLFEISNLVDGQESSTRYIKMNKDSLVDADVLGIPDDLKDEWKDIMSESFDLYNTFYNKLDEDATNNPDVMNIPKDIPDKVKTRIKKNYALDRSRYFIPMATKTSAAYIMTARVWAETIKQLDSLPIRECNIAADLIRKEVAKIAPRLMKHSYPDNASVFHAKRWATLSTTSIAYQGCPMDNIKDRVWLTVDDNFPSFVHNIDDGHFVYKENRYSTVSPTIKRTQTRFAFNNIAMAELRDLNRHRTGYKYTPLIPVGFYLPPEITGSDIPTDFLNRLSSFTQKMCTHQSSYETSFHFYSYLLGTQVSFEHSTHLDKLIYEIELRTGLGAHFRYAEHLKQIADVLIQQKPEYESDINIGTAEPE